MLTSLRLEHFKGFDQFTISFGKNALIVGPNNAGKSTIISAIRLCDSAAKVALRRNATGSFQDGDRWVRGYPLSMAKGSGFVEENVRHEFREQEVRLELTYQSKAILHVVWPVDAAPFFWIFDPEGPNHVSSARARELITPVGIVPTLTPLEYEERKLEPKYIQDQIQTRLASRHFRNHVMSAKFRGGDEYADLRQFLLENTPEITAISAVTGFRDDKSFVDLYFNDAGSSVDKEIIWAGDGLQIWFQILFHVWRNRQASVILLDEPDVFLHPDLQRRLVRILEESSQQCILASHAPEMASESATGNVVWVDRKRKSARRVSGDKAFSDLTRILGSGFNLAVARALRSRVALFVEGDDMAILRIVAKNLGLSKLAQEAGLTVVPIGGFSRWPGVEAFAWLKNEFLGETVAVMVVLDRDYRSDSEVQSIEEQLSSAKVVGHIWRMKEIENYLIAPVLLALETKLDESEAADLLDRVAEELKTDVLGQFVASAIAAAPKSIDTATTSSKAFRDFEDLWSVQQTRLGLIPGKAALSRLNQLLQSQGRRTTSARKLAGRIKVDNVNQELASVLEDVEARL